MRARARPPTFVKEPPTKTSEPATTSADTVPLASGSQSSSSVPSGSSRARRLRAVAPTDVKSPPARTSEPLIASARAVAFALGSQASACAVGRVDAARAARGPSPSICGELAADVDAGARDGERQDRGVRVRGRTSVSTVPVAVESSAMRLRGWLPIVVNEPPA